MNVGQFVMRGQAAQKAADQAIASAEIKPLPGEMDAAREKRDANLRQAIADAGEAHRRLTAVREAVHAANLPTPRLLTSTAILACERIIAALESEVSK